MADTGLVGLAVMGQNLVLNMVDHGFSVAVYNRTEDKTRAFLAGPAAGKAVTPTFSPAQLVAAVERPRRIMLMVKAGEAVDQTIAGLLPHLEPGDILIDGGNSHFPDTERRVRDLAERGILFVGSGVSGGEEGARLGPSIMPGGNPEAWPRVKPLLQGIAARTADGSPCCDWVGSGGSGHYVKMVHNGIEYGDMQLISEAYWIMKQGLGMSNAEMAAVFADWDSGELDSFLIEITARILAYEENGEALVDRILDAAGQKGTGKWTGINALDAGMPVTLIVEAVFARALSALKDARVAADAVLPGPSGAADWGDRDTALADLRQALLVSKLVSYAQGYMLLAQASADYGWNLDFGGIALMWREGCIIRSAFLQDIQAAYQRNPALPNLLLDPHFRGICERAQGGWRRTVARAVSAGLPIPAMGTALAFYDGYRSAELPANLIQAQRDYFGAHTYERKDRPRGEFFHTDWIGSGGNISAGTYNA